MNVAVRWSRASVLACAISAGGFSFALPTYAELRFERFQSRDDLQLSYFVRAVSDPEHFVVLVAGRGEPIEKYRAVANRLASEGIQVFGLDVRGQGRSEKPRNARSAGYVDRFADYVSDLEDFSRHLQLEHRVVVPHLIGHSMGATTIINYLQRPGAQARSVVLASPMLGVELGNIPRKAFLVMLAVLDNLGLGSMYIPGAGPRKPVAFETSDLTSSREQSEWYENFLLEAPELVVNGVSVRWMREVIRAADLASDLALAVKSPTLILTAGRDTVVSVERQIALAKALPTCASQLFEASKHEIFFEVDEVRGRAVDAVVSFIRKH